MWQKKVFYGFITKETAPKSKPKGTKMAVTLNPQTDHTPKAVLTATETQKETKKPAVDDAVIAALIEKYEAQQASADTVEISENSAGSKSNDKSNINTKTEQTAETKVKPKIKQNVKQQSEAKKILTQTTHAWIDFTETAKGVASGLVYGFLAGSFVAGINMITSGIKKVKSKEIKPLQILNPKVAMSKGGRTLSYVAAGTIFAYHVLISISKANKKNAVID